MNERSIETTVLARNWARFAPKFEKLARVAKKLGTSFELVVSPVYAKLSDRDAYGERTIRELVDVSLTAEVPVIAGWTFAAAIDHCFDSGNIIRTSPRFSGIIPESFRTGRCTCDHCGTVRGRLTTYALVNANLEWKRVGSSCLRDFTGHDDAVTLAEFVASLDSLLGSVSGLNDDDDGDEFGGAKSSNYVETAGWVALSFRAIDVAGGYVSSTAAREDTRLESTRARLERHLHPVERDDRLPKITDEEHEAYMAKAAAAIAWAASLPGESDFDYNLSVIAKSECTHTKHLGIATYIAEGYRRHLGILAERAARAAAGNESAYLGKIGDKVEFEFVVTGVSTSESMYGTTHWIRGMSGANKVTIKSSNPYISGSKRGEEHEPEIGARFTVAGTVKNTEEFRGTKSTLVTRARARVSVVA